MKPGLVLAGRYELIDRLGAGGMAVVWEAHDLVLDRGVAVKVMAGPGHTAPGRDIRTEALSAARLPHPHIAGVYDYGEIEGPRGQRTPFVVMELLDGAPLSAETTPMSPRRAFRICAEIASALAAAHALGIVAGCYGHQAYVLSWSAGPGYQVKRVEPGPSSVASAAFRSNRTLITMTVTCPTDAPLLAVTTEPRPS